VPRVASPALGTVLSVKAGPAGLVVGASLRDPYVPISFATSGPTGLRRDSPLSMKGVLMNTKHDASDGIMIRSPADIVAAVPYLLGFHPSPASLVLLGFDGPPGMATLRVDLPEPGDEATAEEIAVRLTQVLARNDFRRAVLVGYGPGHRVTPMIEKARALLADCGIEISEALRVDEGRWWSYYCEDPACCPLDGTPVEAGDSVIAAAATFAGEIAPHTDRRALVESLTPYGDPVRTTMRRATLRAQERLADAGRLDTRAAHERLAAEGLPLLRRLIERASTGDTHVSPEEIATLTVTMSSLRVRDEAWCRTDFEHLPEFVQMWTTVLRHAEPEYAAAPAVLLAYVAHQSGNGPLANVALDRAVEANPFYSMAHLLREAIEAGMPPSETRLSMTPEELEAAYQAMEQAQELDGRDA
jgi:hypothetical protein